MDKKRWLCAVLALGLVLAGCAAGSESQEPPEPQIAVYYLRAEDAEGGPLLVSESVPAGADALKAAITALGEEPKSMSLNRLLPKHMPILSWALTDGELVLSMDPSYLSLKGMEKTTVDYGLALTLCPLEGVETLSLSVGGEKVTAGLTAADAVLEDVADVPGMRRLRLYYTDAAGRYLTPEYRMIPAESGGDAPVERIVMEELLRGPESQNLESPIPEGTRLLTVYRDGRNCIVDLSAEFVTYRPDTALKERLAVYSLVNTLCDIAGVDSVQILVEGKALGYYRYLPLSRPLSANSEAAGAPVAARGEQDVDLYMALPGTLQLTAVPAKIRPEDGETAAFALLNKLINGMAHETDYQPLFPQQDAGQQLPKIPEPGFSLHVRDGLCTVLLPAAAVNWCNEQSLSRLAAQSVAYTLLQLPDIRSVYVSCMDDSVSLQGVSSLVPVPVSMDLVIR